MDSERLTRQLPLLLFMAILTALAGCVPEALPATVGSKPASGPATPALAISARPIQLHPLYRQAELACSRKQYSHAASLLAQLADQPGLSSRDADFCREQHAICLRDAGLPAPLLRAYCTPPPPIVADSPARPQPEADCGPRALRMVCERLGSHAELAVLRKMSGTTVRGTSMEGLARASKRLGLNADGVQVSREGLARAEMPAIALVNADHYVAVLAIRGEGPSAAALIHDPNKPAEEVIPQEELLRLCSGNLLLIHR